MTRHLLVLLLGSLATGCGGSVAAVPSESSDGGTMNDGENPPIDLPGPIEGSYDLAFKDVIITPGTNGIPQPGGGGTPASVGASARLDLRTTASGGYEAVITSRWGQPSAYTVKVTSTALTLEGGNATVYGPPTDTSGSDSWTTLVFPRAKAGNLSGAFSAKGSETVGQGDVIWQNDAAAKGTLARDTTPPETKPNFYSNGPDKGLLPWDPIRVQVAEPTDATKLVSAFSVSALPIAWTIEGGSANADWAGAVQAKGVRKTWDPPSSDSTLVTGALTDRAGNSSVSTTTPISFVPMVPGQPSHGFDGDVVSVAFWGDSKVSFLGGFAGSDPSCEQGGCVKMGVYPATVCGAPRIGIAGLIAKSATKVVVRYRVLVNSTLGGTPGTPPSLYGVAFAVDVANPGVEAKTTTANIVSTDLKALATPQFGMSWATDWTTFEAPAPASAPSLGFTVRAGANPSSGCGGPAPEPIDTVLLIDSVDAN